MAAEAEFYRGPHDSLVLGFDEIKRYCHLVRRPGPCEDWLFVMMPPPWEWQRVVCGDLDKDVPFDTLYPYELLTRADGDAFFFRRYDEFAGATGED